MKRIALFLLILAVPVLLMNCGKSPKPVEEVQPTVTTPPPEPPKVEPQVEPQPEVKKIAESDFKIVYFDFDKYNLVDSAKLALENNAAILKDNPGIVVKIEGHCDERGTVEYNISLGEKRAMAAMNYIKELGIDPARMTIISYGKSKPAVAGSNEAAWAKNRRGEFRIMSQ